MASIAAPSWAGLPALLAPAGLMLIAWGGLLPCPRGMAQRLMAGQAVLLLHDPLLRDWIAAADFVGLAVGLAMAARRARIRPAVAPQPA
jgi:hypothetical protein